TQSSTASMRTPRSIRGSCTRASRRSSCCGPPARASSRASRGRGSHAARRDDARRHRRRRARRRRAAHLGGAPAAGSARRRRGRRRAAGLGDPHRGRRPLGGRGGARVAHRPSRPRRAARGARSASLLALADVLRLEVDARARLLRLRARPRARRPPRRPPPRRAGHPARPRRARARPRLRSLVEPAGRDRRAAGARVARVASARARATRAARLAAAVVGALPWLLGNLRHDWYSLHPGANEGTWTYHLHNLVVATLPEALGLRLAWSFEWLGGAVVGYAIYAAVVAGFAWLCVRRPARLAPLVLIVAVFPVFYFVSPYTWLQSEPRYLTLVMPVFALLVAYALTSKWRIVGVFAVALALTVGGFVELDRHDVVAFRTEGVAVPRDLSPVLRTLRAHRL